MANNDLDDEILGTVSSNTPQTSKQNDLMDAKEEFVKATEDDKSITQERDDIPDLVGDNFPPEYIVMVERIKKEYRLLPLLNYTELYSELRDLSIKSSPTPTLQVLNDEIQRVQASKDRLSEIFVNVLKCHTFKKRAVDIMIDSWGKFSSETSADKRKGDAEFRFSDFSCDFSNVEGLLKACTHILKNLDSLHESLSRRITVIQLTIKLNDIGRGALPDSDYDTAKKNVFEEISKISEIDKTEGREPKCENF